MTAFLRVLRKWLKLLTSFGNDFLESLGIEDTRRFGKRAQRGTSATQLTLYLLQFAGLLNTAQRRDDGVEKVEQQ